MLSARLSVSLGRVAGETGFPLVPRSFSAFAVRAGGDFRVPSSFVVFAAGGAAGGGAGVSGL